MPRALLTLFAFLPILILSGCGSGQGPLVPAEGRIWLRGQPLSSGTIVFVPDEEKGHQGRMATAVIEPGGAFRLMTDKLPGAEPGWYRVTIASGEGIVGAKMPKKYSDPSKSGVFRQIQAGIPNTLDIQLE